MEKDFYFSVVNTGRDVVVFAAVYRVDLTAKIAEQIVGATKKRKKRKAVLIGGYYAVESAGSAGPTKNLVAIVAAQGIELIHLDKDNSGCDYIKNYLDPSFAIKIKNWKEAQSLNLTFNHLVEAARRIADIKKKIQAEGALLEEFPLVCKMESLEWHPGDTTNRRLLGNQVIELFQLSPKVESTTNAVALVDPQRLTGTLVTKSKTIKFCIFSEKEENCSQKLTEKILNGDFSKKAQPLRLQFPGQAAEVLLHLAGGNWWVLPHPELQLNNSSLHYIPLWQRIRSGKLKNITFFHNSTAEARQVEKFLQENNYALLEKGYSVVTTFADQYTHPKILVEYRGYEGIREITAFIMDRL